MRATILLLIAALGWAETLDRLAVSVGDEIITEQQVLLYLRTAALLNAERVQATRGAKRAAAQKLIEITLIRIEMQNNRYPLPTEEQIAQMLVETKRQRFGASEEKYQAELARVQISEADLKESLKWQLAILSFIDFRFRPGVQIAEDELKDYYEYEYKGEGGRKAPYEQARQNIMELLTQQRIDNLLDRWLNQTETATRIRWAAEVFGGSTP